MQEKELILDNWVRYMMNPWMAGGTSIQLQF